MNRVLFEHVRPLVHHVNKQGWLLTWHFLRESENWRGKGKQPPLVSHIRFRVRTTEPHLQALRSYLQNELDSLQRSGRIADHYRGDSGTPNQDYVGESNKFDERAVPRPEGWAAVQRWLRAGSEIQLIFLKNAFQGVLLGRRFKMTDILHFYCNQTARSHDVTANGLFMVVQM